ncbi:MAG: NAD-dependent deacylase [Ignavibacteriae bacterium]|nr:NAD-dependent deacylase [Ignavibacteriota bacterium]
MNFSDKFRAVLRNAESICVLTGAGVSAESGVPTFRGAEGLWQKFKPEELANFDAFINNPELVWEWYAYRKQVMKNVQPNPSHLALVDMERLVRTFTLVTQNVDNLHTRAGSKNVLELHGNIERSYCIDCHTYTDDLEALAERKVPRCKSCGGLVRPDVVWFGEVLPAEVFQKAAKASEKCDLFLCAGTSAVVYPAASLPLTARERGAYVVEINREYTDLSLRTHETILGNAGEILPEIVHELQSVKERAS